jgi:hypothetical protein
LIIPPGLESASKTVTSLLDFNRLAMDNPEMPPPIMAYLWAVGQDVFIFLFNKKQDTE